MFGNFEFLTGKFGDDSAFDARRHFATDVMKEANSQAFANALAGDNESPIAALLVNEGKIIKQVFGSELKNMAVPLLFAEREEISVQDFFLRGVKDDSDTEDIAGKLKRLLDFVKEGRKSVELFGEVVEAFPVVDRLSHGTGEPQASGLDAWLAAYSDEEYEVGLWGVALLVMASGIVGDEPEVVNTLLGGMPDPVLDLCGKIIVAYRMMFYEFMQGAEPAIAEMREKLYNSL